MRSRKLPLVGLALVLASGIGFGIYFFISQSPDRDERLAKAANKEPRARKPAKERPENNPADQPTDPQPARDSTPAPRANDTQPRPRDPVPPQPAPPAGSEIKLTITGRVLDETGNGLPGIDVKATVFSRKPEAPPGTQLAATATSGAEGRYTIELAEKVAAKLTSIDIRLTSESRGWTLRSEVVLTGIAPQQSRSGVDMQVTGAGNVTGRVVDREGQPQPGVAVTATRVTAGDQPAARPGNQIRSAKTTDDGNFAFENLPAGNWQFQAVGLSEGKVSTKESLVIEAGADLTVADLVVREPLSLKFTLVQEDGQAASDKDVTLTFRNAEGVSSTARSRSDERGGVDFRPVPADAVDVRIRVSGFIETEAQSLASGMQEVDLGDIRLAADPDKAPGQD